MAMNYYRKANDHASLVRLYCVKQDYGEAMRIAVETGDPTACFHLARAFEAQGNIREAIQYYQKSLRFHHAVRLARENGFD